MKFIFNLVCIGLVLMMCAAEVMLSAGNTPPDWMAPRHWFLAFTLFGTALRWLLDAVREEY